MRYYLTYLIGTLLRFFPLPQRTGLIKIGDPTASSPVLLTGNFRLTVELVKKAVRGLDLYLLIANSKGINVWCAATGGHLNNHSVISVIKTSGIGKLVEHKNIILPQLAATGIERRVILDKTGWKVHWGPVEANNLPEYLEELSIAKEKRVVSFSLFNRMEMATAWIFPLLIINALIFIWTDYLLITSIIVISSVLFLYLTLPIYIEWLIHSPKGGVFNPRLLLIQFGSFLLLAIMLLLYGLYGNLGTTQFILLNIFLYVILVISSIDLLGSTPLYKSNLHHQVKITLDVDRCRGAEFCEIVCPKNCFVITDRKASIPDEDICVQCGACIVQCPFDALYFTSEEGIISAKSVRTFKLNMMGDRVEQQ